MRPSKQKTQGGVAVKLKVHDFNIPWLRVICFFFCPKTVISVDEVNLMSIY